MHVEGVRSPSARSLSAAEAAVAAIQPSSALAGWYQKYAKDHVQRLAIDIDLVDRFAPRDATIVELGAVPLILTLALTRLGRNVKGVDLAPSRFAETIQTCGLSVSECDVDREELPFAAETADVLLFNELFEHLRINPVFSLKEAHRVLKPDGTLLLSTPNLRSVVGLSNLLLRSRSYAVCGPIYDEYEKLDRLGHMGHVREYAPGDVRTLLERIGFRVEAMIFRGPDQRRAIELGLRFVPQFRRFVTYVGKRT